MGLVLDSLTLASGQPFAVVSLEITVPAGGGANPTLATATRTALADVFTTLLDAGAGAGKLKLYDSGDNPLGECDLNDPSAPGAVAGVWTADVSPEPGDNASASGDVDYYTLTDSDDNVVYTDTNVSAAP